MNTDVLTDDEAQALGLPSHIPGTKDPIEWGRSQSLAIEPKCSGCGHNIKRTIEVPSGIAVGAGIKFTCKTCNGEIGISRNGRPHRKLTLAQRQARKKSRPLKGQESKPRPESGQSESPLEAKAFAPLCAGLLLRPSALPLKPISAV